MNKIKTKRQTKKQFRFEPALDYTSEFIQPNNSYSFIHPSDDFGIYFLARGYMFTTLVATCGPLI